MALDLDAEALRELIDRALEAGVVECNQAAALLADQMMVVGAVRMAALEPGLPITHGEALDEAVLDEQLQDAIDACAAGRATARAQRVLDLDRAERARLRREQLDHPVARSAVLQPRAREHAVNVVAPVRRRHPDKTSVSNRPTGMRLNPITVVGCGVVNTKLLVLLALLAFAVAGCAGGSARPADGSVRIVAAENFWGSIATQLGARKVDVQSIIVDPGQDPHSYEPTAADARTLATAQLAIVNGIGYDPWARRLLAANGTAGTIVLDVGGLLGLKEGDNPHRWYDPADVEAVANAITGDLKKLDPRDASYFDRKRAWFESRGLARYHALITSTKHRYSGVPVGASESIFALLAPSLGLRLITPQGFMKAISEGTDVDAQDAVTTRQQISLHRIAVWIYNSQNATPDIQRLNELARAAGIPVATVTETLSPANYTFQRWQATQLEALAAALHRATSR